MGRRWLAVAATALVTAYVALVAVPPAAETSCGYRKLHPGWRMCSDALL